MIFSLKGLYRVSVGVLGREEIGYRVSVSVLPGTDEMWENLTHEALLPLEMAERLADSVRKRGTLDLDHWVWTPSRCSPFAALQMKPSAMLQTTRYLPRA